MATLQQAEARTQSGFFIHLGIYAAVVFGLAVLNMVRSPENLWVLWVAGGWGLGVLIHGALFYFVPAARDRMIRREKIRMEARAHE